MSEVCANYDLATKYQPQRLADKFEGLDANVNKCIARAIAIGKLPRRILLTGGAGTGNREWEIAFDLFSWGQGVR